MSDFNITKWRYMQMFYFKIFATYMCLWMVGCLENTAVIRNDKCLVSHHAVTWFMQNGSAIQGILLHDDLKCSETNLMTPEGLIPTKNLVYLDMKKIVIFWVNHYGLTILPWCKINLYFIIKCIVGFFHSAWFVEYRW